MADHRRTRPEQTETEDDESFVARWSRRKHEVRQEHPGSAPAEREPPADTPDTPDTGPGDADLPPPESLDADSDYSGYLSDRVSEGLRRAALRKLFRLPQFNVRDGLDDYDEDYRNFSALGDTVTADMRHHEERLREKERLREEEEARTAAGEQADDAADGTEPAADDATDEADAADEPDEDTDHA